MESYYQLFKDDSKLQKEDLQDTGNLEKKSINTFKSVDINKNIYIDKKQCDFKQIEDIVNSDRPEEFGSDKEVLEHFAELEKIVLMKIKFSDEENISKFNIKILKDMAYDLLENKFREYTRFRELYKKIKNIFLNFFEMFNKDDSFIDLMEDEEQIFKMLNENTNTDRFSISYTNMTANLKNHQRDGEKVSNILGLFKKLYNKNINLLTDKLNKFFGTYNFPFFLIRTAKFKIKRKINRKYLPKFKEIFLRNNFLNSLEYLIILDKIKEISEKKLTIFDEIILNLEEREIMLKIIIALTSSVFIKLEAEDPDEYFRKLFTDIVQKCFYALNVNVDMISINSQTISIKNYSLASLNQIINEAESLQDLFRNLESSLKNDLHKYLFIILSLTLLFNNFDLNQRSISYSSAREKECLKKILCAFNQFFQYEKLDVWKFNQILESVIFSTFYKNKYSVTLLSEKSFFEDSKSTDEANSDKNKKSNLKGKINFSKINRILTIENTNMNTNFIEEYNLLLTNIPKKQKTSCCQHICKFFKEFFLPYEEKEISVDLNLTSLVPYDKYNYSNHVCIIIPGFISQYHNNHKQWENFIIDFDIYVDFYFYVWESKTGMKIINDVMKFLGGLSLTLLTRNFLKVFGAYRTYQHKNNLFAKTTRISKYFGKLLAYILASKAFFEKRSITLVGFSLGGHILKHCLKELVLISEYIPEVKDLIQNAVFIGAATTIPSDKELWKNIYKFISGRIINCYCPNDEVLQGIFKYITQKDSLGIIPLKIESMDNLIENYDFSELNIKHVEYKCYLNEIIKKINLF